MTWELETVQICARSLITSLFKCPLVFFKLLATVLEKGRSDAIRTGVAECEGLSFREKGDTSQEVKLAPLGGTAGFGIACFTSLLPDRIASLICNHERCLERGSFLYLLHCFCVKLVN